jgi:hypothetical protein
VFPYSSFSRANSAKADVVRDALMAFRTNLPRAVVETIGDAGHDLVTDHLAGVVATKSAADVREVPIAGQLRSILLEHRLATGGCGYVVAGRTPDRPFTGTSVIRKARRARTTAGLMPIGLHEARHTFASTMIAAGVNLKAISAAMGHACIAITLDRYGHLVPGSAEELVSRVDTPTWPPTRAVRGSGRSGSANFRQLPYGLSAMWAASSRRILGVNPADSEEEAMKLLKVMGGIVVLLFAIGIVGSGGGKKSGSSCPRWSSRAVERSA